MKVNSRIKEVLARAAVVPEFRAGLLANPVETLEQASGTSLPKGLRIRFIERPDDVDALFVLPNAADEIADKDWHFARRVKDVLLRSAVDREFRFQLLVDPVGTLTSLYDYTHAIKVRFIEKPEGVDLLFVLPDSISADLTPA